MVFFVLREGGSRKHYDGSAGRTWRFGLERKTGMRIGGERRGGICTGLLGLGAGNRFVFLMHVLN